MADRTTPYQWEDMPRSARSGTSAEVNRIGKNTKSNVASSVEKLRATENNPSNGSENRIKSGKKADVLENIQSTFVDKPITMAGATSRRVGAFERARGYARSESASLPGASWYFGHSDEVKAATPGINFPAAAAASASLSPGKDPKVDELPALGALSAIQTGDHTVTVGKETQAARNLSPQQLAAHLTTAAGENSKKLDRTVTSSYQDFHIGGRPHENMTARGISALRGDVPPHEVNNPVSGPKTSSYFRDILHAGEATTEERTDYESISHHLVKGQQGQGMLMFSQPTDSNISKDSILSPDHDTAEDTWMQGLSSGQKLQATMDGKSFSPAKRAVDKGGPGEMNVLKKAANLPTEIDSVSAVHAFNNKATRKAAAETDTGTFNQHGEEINVPSVMMQEVAWTQARREAGGDAPFNKQQREKAKADTKSEKAEAKKVKTANKNRNSASYKDEEGNTVSQMFIGDDLRVNPKAKPPKPPKK